MYTFTLITRLLAALGFLVVSVVLVLVRDANGPITRALTWAWIAVTVSMFWYTGATVLVMLGRLDMAVNVIGTWGWVVWVPCVVASWYFVYALRKAMKEKR